MNENKFFKVLLVLSVAIGIVISTPTMIQANADGTLLYKGINHPEVKTVQHQLKKYDYYHAHIDGSYGSKTVHGVEVFQKDHNLKVDGIVGPHTKETLNKVKSLQQQFEDAPNLSRGSKNKTVKNVQKQLKQLNFYKSKVDRIYGPLTEKAVIAFQKANDITVDGIVGPETYEALIHNPNRQKAKVINKQEKAVSASSQPNKSDNKKNNIHTKNNNTGSQVQRTLNVMSTAYTAHCEGCSGTTSTGINLIKNPERKVIAVDPNVIPLGSKVWVEGYGAAVAGDIGSAIKGKRIDVFIPSRSKALDWGRKTVKVKILE